MRGYYEIIGLVTDKNNFFVALRNPHGCDVPKYKRDENGILIKDENDCFSIKCKNNLDIKDIVWFNYISFAAENKLPEPKQEKGVCYIHILDFIKCSKSIHFTTAINGVDEYFLNEYNKKEKSIEINFE